MKGRVVPGNEELELAAEEFRATYARDHIGRLNLPLIVEKDLRVEIVPVPRLCRVINAKGYVCNGGKTICVDRDILTYQPEDYLFLIGHETAHIVRHPGLLPKATFTTVEECAAFQEELSIQNRSFMEAEAREWAGRVLIPRRQLEKVFDTLALQYPTYAKELEDNAPRAFAQMVFTEVGSYFGVRPTIAEARLRNDNVWQRLPRCTDTILDAIGGPAS